MQRRDCSLLGRSWNDFGITLVIGIILMVAISASTAGAVGYYANEQASSKSHGVNSLYKMIKDDQQALLGTQRYIVYVTVIGDNDESPLENAYCQIIKNYVQDPTEPIKGEGQTDVNGEWSAVNMEHNHDYGLVVTLEGYETGIEVFNINSSDIYITIRLVSNEPEEEEEIPAPEPTTYIELDLNSQGFTGEPDILRPLGYTTQAGENSVAVTISQDGADYIPFNFKSAEGGINVYPKAVHVKPGGTFEVAIICNNVDVPQMDYWGNLIWDWNYLRVISVQVENMGTISIETFVFKVL